MIAWSSYDAASKTYALRVRRAGVDVDTAAVARSPQPFDLDVGPGPNGAPLVVYSRRGDLFQFDPATGLEQPLAEVNTPGTEVHPSIRRSALAFVRTARGRKARPTLYLRKNGNTRKQPRPKFKETLAIEDVELSDRGLFVVYRTDIVPTCCTRAVLYRVDGKQLRWLFAVGSGGANFGQLVTPSVVGRSVFFARTNDGSGQGNNLFRYDLRTRKLFSARGSSRVESLTWLGDRFLMSRNTRGCIGPPDMDPTATPTCELVITDPPAFKRASKADRRKTHPNPQRGLTPCGRLRVEFRRLAGWWAPSRSRPASPCSRARRCSRRPASASRWSPRRWCSPPPSRSRRSGC